MSQDNTDQHHPRSDRPQDNTSPPHGARSAIKRNRPYERDMRVVYHVLSKSVLVTFRGEVKMLGPFADRDEAVDAAEEFCRSRGWEG